MKQLYFCRHGESVLNAAQTYAGQTDTPLTEKGRQQAHQAGQQATDLHIGRIVCSTLSRAHETAQIIAEEIGYPVAQIIVNELFIEQSFGSLEGLPWSTPNPEQFNDTETDDQLASRAAQGLAYLSSLPDETVLLVGHGSFGRSLQHLIDPAEQNPELPNATIIKLV